MPASQNKKPAKKASAPKKAAKKTVQKPGRSGTKMVKPAPQKTATPKKAAVPAPAVIKKVAPPKLMEIASAGENTAAEVLLTQEGLKALKEELEYLKDVKRKEVADRLKEAISYGDLSENSEYEEAKNEQAFVEGRILELEKKLKHVKIIHGSKAAVVRIGSTVRIKELPDGAAAEYTVVGSTEADPLLHRISNESPLGKAVLGAKKGDTVTVAAPGGNFRYKIVALK